MNASISLNEIVATSDKVKLAQGIALIMVAVAAAVGVGMFAAPTCVWQAVIGSIFNQAGAHIPIPGVGEFEAQLGQVNTASVISALVAAAYPAYQAIWRLRESLGYECSRPVFCERAARCVAAVDACLLLSILVMACGFKAAFVGSASGDMSELQVGVIAMFVSLVVVPACIVMCPLKRLFSRGPAEQWGDGRLVPELFHTVDKLLWNQSSNFVKLFFSELLASALATVFLAVLIVAGFIAVCWAIGAVCLVIVLAMLIFGLPLAIFASRDN